MVIGRERFGETPLFHDHEGPAIREAPILVGAAPVQLDRSAVEVGIERNDLDSAVSVNSPVTLRGHAARRRVGQRLELFPEDCLGRHDLAPGPRYSRVPRDGLGVILISSARERNPERGVGEVGGHYGYSFPRERP